MRDALTSLILDQRSYVHRVALRFLRDPQDAADATQEVLLKAIRAAGDFRGAAQLRTWLYRITWNVCMDALGRRRPTTPLVSEGDESAVEERLADADALVQPETALARHESVLEVRRAIAHLTATQRQAVLLFYFEDMPEREISRVMGIPQNTVKSHLHRARARLATTLREPHRLTAVA